MEEYITLTRRIVSFDLAKSIDDLTVKTINNAMS
jgi:hypothetical protein